MTDWKKRAYRDIWRDEIREQIYRGARVLEQLSLVIHTKKTVSHPMLDSGFSRIKQQLHMKNQHLDHHTIFQ